MEEVRQGDYIALSVVGKLHLVTGRLRGELQLACGRGFSRLLRPVRVAHKPPLGPWVCTTCQRASRLFLDVDQVDSDLGGVPVSGPALGTGRRRY